MCIYLESEELIFINEKSLEITHEEFKPEAIRHDDIDFTLRSVTTSYKGNIFRKATAYCIYIICLHPFPNGNHRTSIMAAEHFLLKNGYKSFINPQEDKDLEKFRITYEQEHNLEREFFRITNLDNEEVKIKEIHNIILSKYGRTIEQWLLDHYKQKKSSGH